LTAVAQPASAGLAPIIRRVDDTPADEALLSAYARGDARAFARLYERHERPVYRFLLRALNGNAATADDLLQETWLAVVRNAVAWEPRARFTTWLYTIARSKLLDHWRARVPVVSLDDEAVNDPDQTALAADETAQPEVRVLSRAQARAFVAAVELLPAAQREAFLLHAEGGLSVDELAQATGVGFETAKSRLRYAMTRLRSAMADWR